MFLATSYGAVVSEETSAMNDVACNIRLALVRGLFTVQLGPKSSVVLSTTYLDERVRLGKVGPDG
jgi:hypothetical protein